MSGASVSHALAARFNALAQAEVARLRSKLSALGDVEREHAEAIIGHVIGTLAGVPVKALKQESDSRALEAVVRLFKLDLPADTTSQI